LFETALTGVNGMPLSDTQFQILDRENKQRFLELLFDPETLYVGCGGNRTHGRGGRFQQRSRCSPEQLNNAMNHIVQWWRWAVVAAVVAVAAEEAAAAVAAASAVWGNLIGGGGGGGGGGSSGTCLPNVANEYTGQYTEASNPSKTVRQAIYMVQKMWKGVFLPMALLFLLPGAVLTQTKGYCGPRNIGHDDDSTSPFEGIQRGIVAIFLIPATQLIVSYSIDIGNSMADSVKPWIVTQAISDWVDRQCYKPATGQRG